MRPVERMAPAAILLVDDDALLADTLAEFLRRHGYQTVPFYGGRAAMQHLASHPVALVISDLFMPDCDGIELIESMRRLADPPLLIAMSGSGDIRMQGMLKIAGMLGATRTLPKPFDAMELLSLVGELIGPPVSEPPPAALPDPDAR